MDFTRSIYTPTAAWYSAIWWHSLDASVGVLGRPLVDRDTVMAYLV
jgi:hypothetical protein